MIKHIFLDLDNTILDFDIAEDVALTRVMKEFGIDVTDENKKTYIKINEEEWGMYERDEKTQDALRVDRFSRFFEAIGNKHSGKEGEALYTKYLSVGHWFVDGALELLQDLSKDYKLYLASNGISSIQRGRLSSAKIDEYITDTFISQEIGVNKPSKEYFDYCFSKIEGFRPEEAIMIGDSLSSDIKGAVNAGIKSIWFNRKQQANKKSFKPDYEVNMLEDIKGIIDSL